MGETFILLSFLFLIGNIYFFIEAKKHLKATQAHLDRCKKLEDEMEDMYQAAKIDQMNYEALKDMVTIKDKYDQYYDEED